MQFSSIHSTLFFVLLTLWTTIQADGPDVEKNRFIVYIGIGHSNMEGRASGYDTETHPRCWSWTGSSWVLAKEKINAGSGGGPAMSFLKKMADTYPQYHFGWVEAAASSMYITDFQLGRTGFNMVKSAVDKNKNRATMGGVLTMLGMQESRESKSSKTRAENVSKDFGLVIEHTRQLPDCSKIPFLIGRYEQNSSRYKSGGSEAKFADIVISEIQKVTQNSTRTELINIDGPYVDDHHFDAMGHKKWSEEAVSLIVSKKLFPEGGSTSIRNWNAPPSSKSDLYHNQPATILFSVKGQRTRLIDKSLTWISQGQSQVLYNYSNDQDYLKH